MKRFIKILPLACLLNLSSCALLGFESTRALDRVERGMSREQIKQLLGRPAFRNLAANGTEIWEYRKFVGGYTLYLTQITFSEGRVIQMSTTTEDHRPDRVRIEPQQPPVINIPLPTGSGYPGGYGYEIEHERRAEQAFADFLREVNSKLYKDEKLRFIQDAARRNYFTVDQATRVLKLFTWDDDKLEVLEAIAPRLRDGFNAYKLVDLFTFISSKERARKLLGYRK